MSLKVKALTIWQPWASLIMIGAKPFEFRKWDYRTRVPDLVGQRIVIHAASRKIRPAELVDLMDRLLKDGGVGSGLEVAPALDLLEREWRSPGTLPLAAGLGTAILGKPRKAIDIFKGSVADSDRIDQHIWAWPLTDIKPFMPIVPMRGFQGFWKWPEKVAA